MSNIDARTESGKTVTWDIRSHGLLKTVLEIDHGNTELVTIQNIPLKKCR
ncbi:MAG: hypothetical protein ACNA8K_11145 [Cyclonatronaceae bacterium]